MSKLLTMQDHKLIASKQDYEIEYVSTKFMTPKEKAEELVKKYDFIATGPYEWTSEAKRCAIIAVDEIMDTLVNFAYSCTTWDDFETGEMSFYDNKSPNDYWERVRNEIEAL